MAPTVSEDSSSNLEISSAPVLRPRERTRGASGDGAAWTRISGYHAQQCRFEVSIFRARVDHK